MPTVPLDPDQQAAVDHRDGACLVLAGPGSGKTRVIVERFLALRQECGVDGQLVLTYTVKAAGEMRDRAEAEHGHFDGPVPLLNFHAFGRRVIREWGWTVGVSPTFHLADRAERWLHLAAVLDEVRPRTLWNPLRPHDLIESLLTLIESAKQELVSPEAYAGWAAARLEKEDDGPRRSLLERHAECADVYARLGERYLRRNVLDYDDCILLAHRILRESAAARAAVCEPLRHIMVDEYQDTNLAQARLVELLTEQHGGNLLVVADDDQSIYKFRGASLANLARFRDLHPQRREITLGTNYRSTPEIVAACRAVIEVAAPVSRIVKVVAAKRDPGAAVELWQAPDARSEAHAVAGLCRELIHSGMNGRDIAWLFRRHDDMRVAMAALQELRVPYRVHGGRGYFQQPEIKDLLGLLAAVDDPADSQALVRCLHLPAWRVSTQGRVAAVRATATLERPLCDLLAEEGGAATLLVDVDDAERARACATALCDLHARAKHADARELVFDAIEQSGFLGVLDLERDIERAQAGANLNKFGELLEAFAEWSEDTRLGAALRYISILRDSGTADEVAAVDRADDGVDLLTAHGAKGLEWPVVIVSRCVEQRWPGSEQAGGSRLQLPDDLVDEPAPEGDGHVGEERRLFYVAATRARDRLVFSCAQRYRESFRDERLTPFLSAIAERPEAPVLQSRPFVPPLPTTRRPATGNQDWSWPRPSVRDLRDFRECPRRYEYRRRYHMPVRPSVQQWYGTLMHSVLERAGRLRHAGDSLDGDRLAALWQRAWEDSHGPKGAAAELRGYGEQTLRVYAQTPAWTQARIAAVEQPFALRVDEGEVRGRFDRIDLPRDGVPVVVDYKTGPPVAEQSAARDLQLRAYAVALSRQEGVEEVGVELHHLQTAEVVRVDLDAAALKRAAGQLGATCGELASAWRERSFPPSPSAWRCRRCDYRTVCDEGREAATSG